MGRLNRLLDEALPLDVAGRRAWLESLPPEHADLACALHESLLPESQTPGVLALATIPKVGGESSGSSLATGLTPGERLGPYELIRLLGAGGMAEVWLAKRVDGVFRREVALKLPMLMRSKSGLAERFASERNILASLEHPNIARLYEAGIDGLGLPYLAMEYVPGQALTQWCDGRRLGIPERVGLFLHVLEAVQYAHQRQVIHRDLKPSNILVSESGEVRLLDFGVAKLLAAEGEHEQLTSVYGRALTPDYASPELLRGDSVDARSDVYSLGVVLYELLCGRRPYRLKSGASLGVLEQTIATADILKPSAQIAEEAAAARGTSPERLVRQLRGDLSVIVLKALAKEPEGRYDTAAEMAQDLQRYLQHRPIQARPAPLTYRAQKFIRRNRPVIAVALIAGVLVLAAGGYELAWRVSDPLASIPPAKPLGDMSIAVLPFVDMSDKKDQGYLADGLSEELIELLTKATSLKVVGRTSSFYFKGKRVTTEQTARLLGVAHVLEGSVRRSGDQLRVTAKLTRASTGAPEWSRVFDRSMSDVFKVQDQLVDAVLGALKTNLLQSDATGGHERTSNPQAYAMYLLGHELDRRGNLKDVKRAVLAAEEAIRLDPGYAPAYQILSVAEAHVGAYTNDPAALERARIAAEHSIALAPGLAVGYTARGAERYFALDFAGAKADFDKAAMLAPGNGSARSNRSVILAVYGVLPDAIAETRRAIALEPLDAGAWGNLGEYLLFEGDFSEARRSLERALMITPGDDVTLVDVGNLNLFEGRYEDALQAYQGSSDDADHLFGVALVEHSRGQEAQSRQALERLMAGHAADAAYRVAQAYAWRGEKNQAFEWLERAYQRRDSRLTDIQIDRLWVALHADPRYIAMLKKLGLVP
jgi:serine/threonine protein kinase/Tfp pilus assembly protein PilF